MASQFNQLVQRVIKASVSNNWQDAKAEWTVESVEKDVTGSSQCVCGQENLVYLYTIRNIHNGKTLFPIGSQCINQFQEHALNAEVTTYRKLFDLLQAVKNGERIELNTNFFSRKLIQYLYDNGAFEANQYNDYNPRVDYDFLIHMFNKRNAPTYKQQRRINALIYKDIIPFAKERLKRPMGSALEDLNEDRVNIDGMTSLPLMGRRI